MQMREQMVPSMSKWKGLVKRITKITKFEKIRSKRNLKLLNQSKLPTQSQPTFLKCLRFLRNSLLISAHRSMLSTHATIASPPTARNKCAVCCHFPDHAQSIATVRCKWTNSKSCKESGLTRRSAFSSISSYSSQRTFIGSHLSSRIVTPKTVFSSITMPRAPLNSSSC